jgi:hypothetical protein
VPKSNKEEKSITLQVNLAVTSPLATTEYLQWSEQPIEFSRDDHPITVPRPRNEPMLLKAQIGTYDVDRVFMDAGSRISLIYAKTLWSMHISLEFLKPTDCSFHRIITVKGSFELSDLCDKEFHKMAQNFGIMTKYGEPKDKIKSATIGAA